MKRILTAVLLCLPFIAPAPAAAQATAPAAAQTDEEAAVRAVVVRLFDGMRAGNGAVFAEVFTPDARLQTAAVRRDGTTALTSMAIDSFAAIVSQPRDFILDERLDAWHVRVDGPLAIVTVDYSFYAGERFSHCGIDAFQMFKSADGWKIFQLTDTRRTTGCPAPNESRP
ncbi:MAG TPA: nuclear transport factor 2 family protein [Longimicrobium sp.]|nr:nuclear transport factor 2 family protein [Longimicrobium sp.]